MLDQNNNDTKEAYKRAFYKEGAKIGTDKERQEG